MQPVNSLGALVLSVLASIHFLVRVEVWKSYGPPFPFVSDLAVAPDDELVVYATAGSDGSWQHPSAVFRSSDGGFSWASLAAAPAGEIATAVVINPSTSSQLLAATVGPSGSRLYRTPDAGATWSFVVDFPSCYGPSIVFDRTLTGRAYAACGELLRSDDGITWSRLGVTSPAYSALSTGADGAVYLVDGDHVLRSPDHGDSWVQIVTAPAVCPTITAFAVDPENPGTMYVGTGRATGSGHFDCGGLYKSLDGGRTLSRTPLPDQYVTDIAVDPTDPLTVYTSSVSVGFFSPTGRVSQSVDAGQSWRDFGLGQQMERLVLSSSGRLLYGSLDQNSGGVFLRTIRKPSRVPPRDAR